MTLAAEIIDELGSENIALTQTLLKTKILLHRIGLPELAEWVNYELNGYPEGSQLPSYRVIPSQVVGNIANHSGVFHSHPIPIGHLSLKQREGLGKSRMDQSLAVLQDFSIGGGGQLQATLPLESNAILGKSLAPGFVIQRAWCQISRSDVKGILVQVRSRLLDFLLSLEKSIPKSVDESKSLDAAFKANVAPMFNSAIFGDNATFNIVVGDKNSQVFGAEVVAGDIDSLMSALRAKAVSESDLEALKNAIKTDAPEIDIGNKQLGRTVKIWFDSMLAKAADASWQIELNVAAGILTTKLQAFYGWLA